MKTALSFAALLGAAAISAAAMFGAIAAAKTFGETTPCSWTSGGWCGGNPPWGR